MSYTIAIAGKGGTGKTTLSALIIKLIKENKKGSLLAVDADPNSNLGEFLGVKVKDTIGSILDDIASDPSKIPSGMPKERFLEYKIQTAIQEEAGFDVLSMGRPEGPGCYCYVNNVLRNILSKIVKDYDYIVIDNEAGLEHLSRRTMRAADALLVISDPSAAGLRTAKRIYDLIKELKIKTRDNFLVLNRSDSEPKSLIEGLDFMGSVPEDDNLREMNINGKSLLNLSSESKAFKSLRNIGDKIWH